MRLWFRADELCPVYNRASVRDIPDWILGPDGMFQVAAKAHEHQGHFQMEVPDEVAARWERVMEEFAQVQQEMQTWHKALVRSANEESA